MEKNEVGREEVFQMVLVSWVKHPVSVRTCFCQSPLPHLVSSPFLKTSIFCVLCGFFVVEVFLQCLALVYDGALRSLLEALSMAIACQLVGVSAFPWVPAVNVCRSFGVPGVGGREAFPPEKSSSYCLKLNG